MRIGGLRIRLFSYCMFLVFCFVPRNIYVIFFFVLLFANYYSRPTHPAAATAFFSAVSSFPGVDSLVLQALNVLSPFLTALTPQNLSTRFHNGIAVSFSLNPKGEIVSTRISIAEEPIKSFDQLLYLPASESNRSFDVFYHLLLAEAENRGAYLSLKSSPEQYDLLRKSATYKLPDWVNFSDDYALAKDWSDALRQCGFKGAALRGVLSTLSGILLLGNKKDPNDVAEGASLIGIDPSIQSRYSSEQLIVSAYTALVQNVVAELNSFLAKLDLRSERPGEEGLNEIVSVVTVAECADHHRPVILRNAFDNSVGINAELQDDGLQLPKTPALVTKALQKMETAVSKMSSNLAAIADFRDILDSSLSYLSSAKSTTEEALNIPAMMSSNRIWTVLNIASCPDAAGLASDSWLSSLVSTQIRELFVTEWAQKRRQIDFTADFESYEFLERYSALLPPNLGAFNLEQWARQDKGWEPADCYYGKSRLWVSEVVYRDLELGLDNMQGIVSPAPPFEAGPFHAPSPDSFRQGYPVETYTSGSFDRNQTEQLLPEQYDGIYANKEQYAEPDAEDDEMEAYDNEYFLKKYHDDVEREAGGKQTQVESLPLERRVWVWFVWLLTFWIPSPFLKYIWRMKRAEVRMAWREKLVLCFLIFLLNAAIIFYMIFLGNLICPNYDKVWSLQEVATHQGDNDFYVAIHGNVYDITKFWRLQHSDTDILTTPANMIIYAGLDLSDYFPPPLTVACPALVTDVTIELTYNTTTSPYTQGLHQSGAYFQPDPNTVLHNYTWYNDVFTPKIMEYYKGRVVATKSDLETNSVANGLYTVIIQDQIYDMTNYMLTINQRPETESPAYKPWNFFDDTVTNMFINYQGQDITTLFYSNAIDELTRQNSLQCMQNAFMAGEVDFRNSAKCQTSNVILLILAGILTTVTLVKFLASIRFGGKKVPAPQDKFVICQIPAYTESEEDLRLAVDSLTNLKYDNRRKLLLIICDGMIVGAGNDRPTPRIVLDLLGVDDKIDPPALPYSSLAEGANQLNYGKIYSGLYENEGNVVPFIVVAKVGRPQETHRPGNRGKRDSQILVMNFLNRVHYQKPMSPLELELFHHMNNVIGVDPEIYEYLFMVDADTSVQEDSLTRLVAACANDSRIAGICGETGLQNEEKSWTTMVQVYEYFISHHLTKAFESLFGSVTCLPGCFSMYRLKTAKKYKPLFISNEVIRDYSVIHVDTLHKKNLFSLGEDRYLTTLMAKYFPKMKYTFIADAYCQTAAPDKFSVLLSQRRRWINSTVHNLVELLRLDNMCGFCCIGMRGVVFIDLIGTVMLPSVCVYLGYLIYRIASHTGPLPLISIVLIAAVYGLQALVFILRRQWQHVSITSAISLFFVCN
jgi:chitin synthase